MSVEIVCIEEDNGNHYNKHEAINTYGWWDADDRKIVKTSRNSMVSWIEEDKDEHKAYVVDRANHKKAYCFVRKNSYGTKLLQTYADGDWKDNLLSLGECK